jgi:hypothetical protein
MVTLEILGPMLDPLPAEAASNEDAAGMTSRVSLCA